MKNKISLLFIIVVVFILIWSVGPILWSVVISITSQKELYADDTILPKMPTLTNYFTLMDSSSRYGQSFVRGMKNSITSSLISIVIIIPISVLSAYAFSRLKFKGEGIIRMGLLITFVVPVFATIIALYQMLGAWGLLNSQVGLIAIYASAFFPLIVWIMINYFSSLPRELEEAAWIDGCSRFQSFYKIILPLSYPVLFTGALIIFLSTWNQFLIPLIMAPSPTTKPLTVVITEFVTKNSQNFGLISAGGLLALIPPALIAIVFRKYIASGLVAGATK
ncbi:MAG: carbohydrate ABC transporter permease [Anaerolineaceae bacterium]